jgi:hypothetical protein
VLLHAAERQQLLATAAAAAAAANAVAGQLGGKLCHACACGDDRDSCDFIDPAITAHSLHLLCRAS